MNEYIQRLLHTQVSLYICKVMKYVQSWLTNLFLHYAQKILILRNFHLARKTMDKKRICTFEAMPHSIVVSIVSALLSTVKLLLGSLVHSFTQISWQKSLAAAHLITKMRLTQGRKPSRRTVAITNPK